MSKRLIWTTVVEKDDGTVIHLSDIHCFYDSAPLFKGTALIFCLENCINALYLIGFGDMVSLSQICEILRENTGIYGICRENSGFLKKKLKKSKMFVRNLFFDILYNRHGFIVAITHLLHLLGKARK